MFTLYSQSRSDATRYVSSQAGNIERCIKDYSTPENVMKYEENAQAMEYKAPVYCAQMLAGIFVHARKYVRVLDLASGPGQVGEELSRHGFENVHAHDGSCAMLDVCRRKKVYSKFICSVINDDTGLPVRNGFYDAVVTSGAVLENHLPVSSLAEIIRVTKSGGFCIVAYSSDILSTNYGKTWEKEMKKLEEDGLWSRHCKVLIPNFYINTRGVVDVLQVA